MIRTIALVGVVAMTVIIAIGLVSGDFFGEGSEILALTWGRVTLVDLYVGLALFGTWVAIREGSWVTTVLWLVALVTLGNLAAAAYVAQASFRSSDLGGLLLGHRAK